MSDVDEIKSRLDIVDVVGQYIKLERAGKNHRAKCPFHNEKDPSFYVSSERQSYYCFGCHSKGDMFTFVQEFEGLDFPGVLKLLAERAGVTLSYKPQKKEEKTELFEVLEEAARLYEGNLEKADDARRYLEKRGITEETIKLFLIGYAPAEWRFLKAHMEKLGYETDVLREAGLIKTTEEGKKTAKHYDRFRGRVMFPIHDTAGRVIAFSGRLLKEKKKAPKYLNSPETPLFNKSKTLYGFDKAKSRIRKFNFSILVEGQLDLVLAHQAGYGNTVASSGTSITPHHLNLLKRFSDNLILAFDNDEAGLLSARRASETALALGMDVKVADLPLGSDPADVISKGVDGWRKAIRNSLHIIDYLLNHLRQTQAERRTFLKRIHTEVLPLLSRIPNTMDREHFIGVVSKKTELPESAVREELGKVNKRARTGGGGTGYNPAVYSDPAESAAARKEAITRHIIGIIEWQGQSSATEGFDLQVYRKRLAECLDGSYEAVTRSFDIDELIFEAERMFTASESPEKDLELLFLHLKEVMLRRELEQAQKALKAAEEEGDEGKSVKHLKTCQELSLNLAKVQEDIQKEFHVI